MSTGLLLGLLAGCVLSEGFFSGSEIAVVSADRHQLRAEAQRGGKGAGLVLSMLERPTWLLGTCLIGTNLATISGATISAILVARLLGLPEAWAVLFFWPITLTFGELVPKAIYQHHADRLAPLVVWPLKALSWAFAPALILFEKLATLLGAGPGQTRPAATREEIRLLLEAAHIGPSGAEGEGEDALRPVDRALIRRVFQFTESVVEDAMKPLIEVVAVSTGTTLSQVARKMALSGHSRLPVYRDRIDQIVGMVLHQDVLASKDWTQAVGDSMRPCMFVPETKRVDALLVDMRRQRAHMAVAVDEYGGAVGIITIEDLLEEIVGEIQDESDRDLVVVRRSGEKEWTATGRAEADDLLQACGFVLPDGDYATLAGYILATLGRVPRPGELVTAEDFVLTVTKASDRAIQEVVLRRRR